MAKGNMDCVYTASKSGITVRFTSPCFSAKYQVFIDSIVNYLAIKIKRLDTTIKIWVLVNFEHLYFDFSGSPNYFTSLGVDTLREINSDYISDYCTPRYGSSLQSKLRPLDINATDEKNASKEIGVKIIYNADYRKEIDWTEIEKLITYSAFNFAKIKTTQVRDTVRHYSWYVSLLTLDTFTINKIVGRQSESWQVVNFQENSNSNSNYWIWVIIPVIILGLMAYYCRQHSS
ncbi:MAG: hypothetical protein U0T79_05305 [Ferruginibacter sp.]